MDTDTCTRYTAQTSISIPIPILVSVSVPIPGIFTNNVPGIGIDAIQILGLIPILIPEKDSYR